MTTSRISIRVRASVKAIAEKAAMLKGMNLTEYVVHLIESDAKQPIEAHAPITVKNDVFDRFMEACESAKTSNEALKNAAAFVEESGMHIKEPTIDQHQF